MIFTKAQTWNQKSKFSTDLAIWAKLPNKANTNAKLPINGTDLSKTCLFPVVFFLFQPEDKLCGTNL